MDKSGLTSVKDASLFDVNTFMKSYDSYIYIISGYKEKTLFGVERLDMTWGQWQDMNPLNISRTKFGVVTVGSWIYAIGGKLQDGSRTDMIESYNVQDDSWNIEDFNLPKPWSGFSCCILNESLIFIVGGNDGSVLDSVACYNLKTK